MAGQEAPACPALLLSSTDSLCSCQLKVFIHLFPCLALTFLSSPGFLQIQLTCCPGALLLPQMRPSINSFIGCAIFMLDQLRALQSLLD